MKKTTVLVLAIIILGVILVRSSSVDPHEEFLRKPVEEIREYLLELTPVGTSMGGLF